MEVDQLKIEIEDLKKSPEYKKHQRALILFLIGIISYICGLIGSITHKWSFKNGSGVGELYICSLTFYFIGIGFLLVSIIGLLLIPKEFRKKIKELNKEIRLKGI